jgi:hypothetical protein
LPNRHHSPPSAAGSMPQRRSHIRFLKHRIGDKRIIRLVQKWLRAGVLEDGVVTIEEKGTATARRHGRHHHGSVTPTTSSWAAFTLGLFVTTSRRTLAAMVRWGDFFRGCGIAQQSTKSPALT